jgi:hypothetical protein
MTDIAHSGIDARGDRGIRFQSAVTRVEPNPLGALAAGVRATETAPLIDRVTSAMFEIVDDAAPVIAEQMINRVPDLGPLDDGAAFEATRRSALGSMYELLCITRAGLTAPSVIETSPEALEHLRFLRARGVGMGSVLRFYHIGFAMFEPILLHELARVACDQETVQLMAAPLRQFVFTYVDQITKRLAAEYGAEREGWVADPEDVIWHDPDSVHAASRLIENLSERERLRTTDSSAVRAHTQSALDRFCAAMRAAAQDERMSAVLSRAKTTVRIELADDPDLSVTLLLDRDPIELTQTDEPAEVEISIVSVDLARLYSPDFHLAMAITRGRVGYTGPVRKFLRVTPVVRHASLPTLLENDAMAAAR